jgi:hypothetical protein
VNGQLLLQKYSQIPGVVEFNKHNMTGSGDMIDMKWDKKNKFLIYTLSKGWTNCETSCHYRHRWEFKVTQNIPKLVREYGDPVGYQEKNPNKNYQHTNTHEYKHDQMRDKYDVYYD